MDSDSVPGTMIKHKIDMNNTAYICMAVVALAACSTEATDMIHDPGHGIFMATAHDTRSKAILGAEGEDRRIPVLWESGDNIAIFGHDGNGSIYTAKEISGNKARFIYASQLSGNTRPAPSDEYTAIYPASACKDKTPSIINMPEVQAFTEEGIDRKALIMYAGGASGHDLEFLCGCGILRLNISSEASPVSITEIRAGANQDLSGPIGDFSSGDIIWKPGSSQGILGRIVTLDCGSGIASGHDGKSFYIAVPPGAYTNMIFQLHTSDDKYMVYAIPGMTTIAKGVITSFKLPLNAFYIKAHSIVHTGAEASAILGLEYILKCDSDKVSAQTGSKGAITLESRRTMIFSNGTADTSQCSWNALFSTDNGKTFSIKQPAMFKTFPQAGSGSIKMENLCYETGMTADSCIVRIIQPLSGKHTEIRFFTH